METIIPPITEELSLEEKERLALAAREHRAHQRLTEFLDALDGLVDSSKHLQDGTVTSLIGYPLWMRLVYCHTTPTDHLIKETQSFQVLPEPAIMLEIHRLIRELLADTPFVSHVQAQPTKRDRRNWLENSLRTSTRKGLPFVHFAGKLTRLPAD